MDAQFVIDGYDVNFNDRFTNHPSFLVSDSLFAGGLSGVGRSSAGNGWLTMISPNVAISDGHSSKAQPITFFLGNDPVTRIERNYVNRTRIPGTDLDLLTLESPLPAGFKVYGIATENIEQPVAGFYSAEALPLEPYLGENAYTMGINSNLSGALEFRQAVGQNRISHYVENAGEVFDQPNFFGANTDLLFLGYNGPDGSLPFESINGGGDSGAPLFYDDGSGELLLLGVNSAVGTVEIGGIEFDGSYISYIGNHSAFINSYVAAAAVPEPVGGVAIPVIGFLIGFTLRRRRFPG